MRNIVVTIARQYGSGGKTLGNMLAEQMGVHVYNREILKLASEDSGINEALFNQVDEKLRSNILSGLMTRQYQGDLFTPENVAFLSDNNLFNYQAKVIKHLAETESCVIIGRCADYVLREYDNVVSVFVHASPEYCREQALLRGSYREKDIDKYIQKTDKYRADYYKYYTNHNWYDARNYDLSLNSERLGYQGCVDMILSYISIRFGEVDFKCGKN